MHTFGAIQAVHGAVRSKSRHHFNHIRTPQRLELVEFRSRIEGVQQHIFCETRHFSQGTLEATFEFYSFQRLGAKLRYRLLEATIVRSVVSYTALIVISKS